jgi:peptide/nickel transport system ATP-binding protein
MSEPLLCLDNVCVAYPSRDGGNTDKNNKNNQINGRAVDRVSFNLEAGERLGLVGESGCGKSTLGRAAMRLLPEDSCLEGEIRFQGRSVFTLNERELRLFRGEVVGLVFQDPMTRLDPLMTIGNHCLETLLAHKPELSARQAKEIAIATLETVKIPAHRWNSYSHEFSGGMRQRVAIALALLLDPKVIVADEPTTSLDVTVAAEILDELTRLCRDRALALLLISHDLPMVAKYCDRIAVMYRGELVESGTVKEVFYQPQHEYTKTLLRSALHYHDSQEKEEKGEVETAVIKDDRTLLKLEEVKQHFSSGGNLIEQLLGRKKEIHKAVDGINFEIQKGETLGLVGESGCGKSTLSRTILQILRPTEGKVEFEGKDLSQLSTQDMRPYRRQMQMIFQDPHACLNPLMTVGESIADPLLIHRLASPEEAKKQVEEMLAKVGLHPIDDYYNRYPKELSGGQQQRVAIARALITHPKLVICDEPVSMLDATVQTQVLELMLALKQEFRLTYLFITHDLWVAKFFCDRIAVMNGGKIVEIGAAKEVFDNPQHPYTQKLLGAAPML